MKIIFFWRAVAALDKRDGRVAQWHHTTPISARGPGGLQGMEGAGGGAMGRPPPPPISPRHDDGGTHHHLGAVALAFLSSTALFVAATFQAASQRPSLLVRVTK